jgi:cytochrome c
VSNLYDAEALKTSKQARKDFTMTNITITRRGTFMLALGGAAGIADRPRQARAEGDEMVKSRAASASPLRDLKTVGPEGQVTTVRDLGGTFEITTADGRVAVISEINLRFKIDSSVQGPLAGRPIILPGRMAGDRATMFFATPAELGDLIEQRG